MSDYVCHYNCSYRTNSGFCGYTGGYDACQYRRIKRRTVYRGDVYNAIEAERIITNADRIRAMSDEELADYLICDVEVEAIRRAGRFLTAGEINRAITDCLDWLKQEVKE